MGRWEFESGGGLVFNLGFVFNYSGFWEGYFFFSGFGLFICKMEVLYWFCRVVFREYML